MSVIFLITAFMLLGTIAWQDFTIRQISVVLFPAVMAMLFIEQSFNMTVVSIVNNAFINLLFLLAESLVIVCWLFMRYKSRNIIRSKIPGAGDILLLFVVSVSFTLPQFIGFIILCAFTSLIVYVVGFIIAGNSRIKEIPFAGISAVLFILFRCLDLLF